MEPDEPPDLSKWRTMRKQKVGWSVLPLSATVIAFDPGGSTGWSLLDVWPEALCDPDFSIIENTKTWQHGTIDCGATKGNLGKEKHRGISTTGEAAGIMECVGLVRQWPGAAVVIEDFIPQKFDQARDFLSPVRIQSAMSQWLWQQHREYFVQMPAMAKTTVTDARLKRWKMWDAHASRHARDADRHAILFLRQCKSDQQLREWAFPHLYAEGAPYALPGALPPETV